jgi:hypothetical protein
MPKTHRQLSAFMVDAARLARITWADIVRIVEKDNWRLAADLQQRIQGAPGSTAPLSMLSAPVAERVVPLRGARLRDCLLPEIANDPHCDVLIARLVEQHSADFAQDPCFGPLVANASLALFLEATSAGALMFVAWLAKVGQLHSSILDPNIAHGSWQQQMVWAAERILADNSLAHHVTWPRASVEPDLGAVAALLTRAGLSPAALSQLFVAHGGSAAANASLLLFASSGRIRDVLPWLEDQCRANVEFKRALLVWLRDRDLPILIVPEFCREAVERAATAAYSSAPLTWDRAQPAAAAPSLRDALAAQRVPEELIQALLDAAIDDLNLFVGAAIDDLRVLLPALAPGQILRLRAAQTALKQ